jgi:hypothetical protein
MSEIIIDGSKIEVIVSNTGHITFISNDGKECTINIHAFDNSRLLKFLVKEGYSFYDED